MNITPEQVARIDALTIDPADDDDRAVVDVQVQVDPVDWVEPYSRALPHSSVYVRVVWTPDNGEGRETSIARYARTWLLDSVGGRIWASDVGSVNGIDD